MTTGVSHRPFDREGTLDRHPEVAGRDSAGPAGNGVPVPRRQRAPPDLVGPVAGRPVSAPDPAGPGPPGPGHALRAGPRLRPHPHGPGLPPPCAALHAGGAVAPLLAAPLPSGGP